MDDTFSPVEHARENNEAIQHTLRKLVELWPELGAGDCNLNVLFSNGKVRRAYVHYGPIRPGDLGAPFAP